MTALTLVERLRSRALRQPDRLAYAFLSDGETTEVRMSYGELDRRASAIAARLSSIAEPGERMLLLYPPGLPFIAALFGALRAGVIAVPVYPPHSSRVDRALPRLVGIARNARPVAALTTASLLSLVERFRDSAGELSGMRVLATDELDTDGTEPWQEPAVDASTLAFLQYTSGSTGSPRGVMLTHGNVLHNQGMLQAAFGLTEESVIVSWLPHFHDMGLTGNLLHALYVGAPCILMSPLDFLQRPVRWLEAISRYRGTLSYGPNSAYELCARKVSPEQRAGLDLRSWTVAVNGAEPVNADTLARFAEAFAPCGFRRQAFHPGYGLAEATLIVTGGRSGIEPLVRFADTGALGRHEMALTRERTRDSTAVVACGHGAPDQTIAIVDPETRRVCAADRIGEIWVAGPSIAGGYWNRPEESEATFGARLADSGEGPYLRTGDLGFLADGELFITGRLKDLLIIRGRNHYPQDIEATVGGAHSGLRPGAGAAFSVVVEGEERVVVVQEVERQLSKAGRAELQGVMQAVRTAIADHHELEVYAMRLLPPGAISKTSSGKIQRHACRERYLAGGFEAVAEWTLTPEQEGGGASTASGPGKDAKTAEAIQAWLISRLSERTKRNPERVDPRAPFTSYGLDSLAAVSLSGELEEWLGRRLSPTLAWEYPSIELLARRLAGESMTWAREEGEVNAEPIAIIGMGCRVPGATGPAGFWRLLREGVDAIGEVPRERWDAGAYYDADAGAPGKMNTRWGGFLTGIDLFDAQFFGIAPREAVRMDPQQRLLLEVTWEALQDAGQVPERLAGTRTGVFVGISTDDYGRRQLEDPGLSDAYAGTGSALSIAANRISYLLDLRGPSLAVDTACSSSLVAVHLACASLWRGESTLALAGGVNVILSPMVTVNFTKSGFMSPDGRCKAFDARADGYVRGEGAGVVVLKPLARAVADGDPIYAVIRGSAVNQDGRSNGLTAPNPRAQEAVLEEAYRRAGVSPGQVQYVEAHGTGTLLGDPIEAKALGRVLGEGRAAGQVCALGSVKTNIGHLEAAAGIAGLIKVALSLRHRELPASLHFEAPNPHIPFEELPLRVQGKAGPWPDPARRLVAGVSSFGFGGTNAHVVLEEAPSSGATHAPATVDEERLWLLPLSAHTPEALRLAASSYRAFLVGKGAAALHDICFTAAARRGHHDHRLALVGRTASDLIDQLERFLQGERLHPGATGRVIGGRRPRIAMVFSGQGAQWAGMGRELIEREPLFRETIERCDTLLRAHADWSLLDELRADESRSRLHETERGQPAIVALQLALAALWRRWGVAPDAVVGHSMGEIAAACVADALSSPDALRIATLRGRFMQRAAGQGKMAAVDLSFEEATAAVALHGRRIVVAAHNGPASTVLSGEPAALQEVLDALQRRGVATRLLPGDVAFHSPQMGFVQDDLERVLAGLQPRSGALHLVSTVTGRGSDGLDLTAEYWGRNAREPVRFAEAIEGLVRDGYEVFVEVGPHPILSAAIAECGRRLGRELSVLPSLRRDREESETMLATLAAFYCSGCEPDWGGFYPSGGRTVPLPAHPWQRERFWVEASRGRPTTADGGGHPLLGSRLAVARPTWETRLDLATLRYLDHHRLNGRAVLPASASIEMALAAAAEISGAGSCLLEDVDFRKACFLPDDQPRMVQTLLTPEDSIFEIYGRPSQGEEPWCLHVRGRIRTLEGTAGVQPFDLEDLRARCAVEIRGRELYRAFSEMGLWYGPSFSGIDRLWRGDGEALGLIRAPDGVAARSEDYCLHPALLDACLQVIAGLLAPPGQSHSHRPPAYLPVELRRVRVYRRGQPLLWSHAVLEARTPDSVVARVRVFDEAGRPILDAEGLRCRAMGGEERGPIPSLNELVYEHQWRPRALPSRAPRRLPAPSGIARITSLASGGHGTERELIARYAELEPALDDLCSAFILKALRQLGGELAPGQRFVADAFASRLGIVSRYRGVLNRYLEMLGEDGHLRRVGPGWEACPVPEQQEPEQTWRELLARHPAFYGELTLLGRCAGRLAEILRGERDPLHLIFPDGSLAVAEHLYQDSPSLRFYNTLVRRAIEATVAALPTGSSVRLLEIGAGTGGVTAHVLPKLPRDRTQYVFTDVSPHFLTKAEEKFRRYPCVEYRRLDIEADPFAQGFEPNSFDLILASEVLHATADLRRTLDHVGRLLASEGLLVLLEAVRPARWVDLVFGLTEGWWRFTDRDLRPAYPLLPLGRWRAVLGEAGFADVVEASGMPEATVANAVILARGPRIERAAATSAPEAIGEQALGQWIMLADRGGIGERIADALRGRGARCVMVVAGDGYRSAGPDRFEICATSPADMRMVIHEAIGSDPEACRGIVHLWNLDSPSADQAATEDLEAAQGPGCLSIVNVVQALSRVDAVCSPRLWMITGGAQSVGGAHPTSVAQAPVWGLGRVVASEMPKVRATLVDLSIDPDDDEIQALVDEIWADDLEGEVAVRGGTRHVHRYVRVPAPARRVVGMGTEPFRLELSTPGLLDNVRPVATARREPQTGEVEIQIVAAGLNFSDVMKSLGLYPPSSDPAMMLGLECSGRVTRLGPGVEHLSVGSEVIAVAPHSLGAFVTTPAGLVALKPPRLSFEEAATIPIAFLTSAYALRHLGRLSRGERLLVHSASGGVGLAAIQLAERAGAEIFATAGSAEKRDFLRALGIRHVMDSRSQAFADEILEATHGQGVDVILNSLTGEAISRGLAILSDYGRFLEIGKQDISRNSRLGLAPFRKNLSFFAIDLDRALRERTGLMSTMFQELMGEIREGRLDPLPHRVFSIANATDAFRYMASAQHIGKVVVSFEETDVSIETPAKTGALLRADATYLISGGLGGFGLTVARWMVDGGARHLVLMGRRGDDEDEARRAVMELRHAGAEVTVARADVTRPEDVARVVLDIERSMPPLRGVVHAAMVLEDCLLANLDETLMRTVSGPKMGGAWNLHTRTLNTELDFFVLFSSMSSVFGIPGQGSYAAGNAFLDSLAHYRRARGLPALTINWGYLSEVGWVARQPAVAARLAAQGVGSFTPGEALALLERLLRGESTQVGVMRIDWPRWAEAGGASATSPRFASLVQETVTEEEGSPGRTRLDRRRLLASGPEERRARLAAYLREQVGRVLGLPAARVDAEQPIGKLGLDSLMAVELKNRIEADLGIGLAAVALLEGPSVTELTARLLNQLDGSPREPEPVADTFAIAVHSRTGEIPLSSAQRWMWCLHQLDPENPWCNVPVALRIAGPLDVRAFERSLDEIVRRHEALRARFPVIEDRPTQSIAPPETFELAVTDLGGLPIPERETRAERLAREESRRPFDLERGPLVRAGLLRLAPEEHVAFVTMHHIVSDGWSMDVLMRELEALYPAFHEGRSSPLPGLPIQYADFALWEQQWLASEWLERQVNHWKRRLGDVPPVLEFPTDHPRAVDEAYRGAVAHLDLPAEVMAPLRELGRAEGCTLFMTLLAAFQTLLFRYTGQDDVTVGSFASRRTRPGLEGLIGCFVNHLVLRTDLSGDPSFRRLLGRVREVTLEAYANQDVPYEMLLEALSVKRSSDRTPLFQVAFAVDPVPRLTLPGLTVAELALDSIHSNFDFTLRMSEPMNGLRATVEYNSCLFEAVTIQRLLNAFRTLVAGISVDPDQRITALPLVGEADRHQLLVEWNDRRPSEGLDALALHKLRLARQKPVRGGSGAASSKGA